MWPMTQSPSLEVKVCRSNVASGQWIALDASENFIIINDDVGFA